jgi:hypothetical protein
MRRVKFSNVSRPRKLIVRLLLHERAQCEHRLKVYPYCKREYFHTLFNLIYLTSSLMDEQVCPLRCKLTTELAFRSHYGAPRLAIVIMKHGWSCTLRLHVTRRTSLYPHVHVALSLPFVAHRSRFIAISSPGEQQMQERLSKE